MSHYNYKRMMYYRLTAFTPHDGKINSNYAIVVVSVYPLGME